jgi:hypothetical protein
MSVKIEFIHLEEVAVDVPFDNAIEHTLLAIETGIHGPLRDMRGTRYLFDRRGLEPLGDEKSPGDIQYPVRQPG